MHAGRGRGAELRLGCLGVRGGGDYAEGLLGRKVLVRELLGWDGVVTRRRTIFAEFRDAVRSMSCR